MPSASAPSVSVLHALHAALGEQDRRRRQAVEILADHVAVEDGRARRRPRGPGSCPADWRWLITGCRPGWYRPGRSRSCPSALQGHGDLHLAAVGRQRIGQQLHHGNASRIRRLPSCLPPMLTGKRRTSNRRGKREPTRPSGDLLDRQTLRPAAVGSSTETTRAQRCEHALSDAGTHMPGEFMCTKI